MEFNQLPAEESLARPPVDPNKGLRKWLWVPVVAIAVLTAGGIIAVAFKGNGTPKPSASPRPQPAVSSTEQSKIGSGPQSTTVLNVTQVIAQQGNIGTFLAQALQVAQDANIQGNLTVSGSGVFGGSITALNFVGNGSQLGGVNAALLNGQPGSYYAGLATGVSALTANAALRNASNTFTAANSFNVGLTSASITDNGALNVTGPTSLGGTTTISSLILGSPLAVDSGGTGLTTVPAASVLYGQGGPTLGVATPGAAGLCLLSGASDVQWGSCSGAAAGVAALDGLTGVLTLNNSSGSGSAVTIDSATTAAKGIASFNATNFSVVAGAVNTIQNIAVTSAPTFAGLTLSSALTVANGGTGAASLTANGVLLGNGAGPVTSLATGVAGQCLLSTAGAPVWTACTGGSAGGVTSLNGQTGVLTVANASGAAGTITINDASTAQKGIASFNATNFSVAGGAVNTIQDIATTSAPSFGQLALSSSQAAAVMLSVNNTNAAATGNLVDLKLNGTSKFSVAPSGNTTIAGTVNGQTITNVASFTGTLGVTGLTSLNGGATVVGTLTANTITPSAALTIGATGQAFTLQGNSASSITATGGGFTTTVAFNGSPSGAVTYNFDRAATAGTYTLCSTAGNCSGVGGGVTTAGGTANKLAKFTAAQGIGNSSITDTGTSITATPTSDSASVFQVQNAAGRSLLNVDTSGNKITLGNITAAAGQGVIGTLVLADGTNDNFGVTFNPATLTANRTLTVPNAAGTIAVSAAGPIQLDAAGNISCPTCLTSGGGGGSAGVSSLDTLTGGLTIANSTGSSTTITINDAKADGATKGIAAFNSTNFSAASGVINTIQDIATTSAPTFGQLSLTSSQAAGTMLLINNTNGAASGNLIDLQLSGSSKFSVAPSGATVVAGSFNVSGNSQFGGPGVIGKVNIQGIASQVGLAVKAQSGQTSPLIELLDNSNNVNASFGINGNALTLGRVAGSGTVTQGQLLMADGTTDNFTATLQPAVQSANVTYQLAAAAAGTYDLCSTAGNCSGVGGGVTTPGGTNGTIPVFTGSQTLGNSVLSQAAGTVTVAGNLSTTGTGYFNANSTSAFNVEQNGVHNNVLSADTTNGTVGIDQAPQAAVALTVNGSTQSSSFIISSSTSTNNLAKNYVVGTGGVTTNQVVVLANDGGSSAVILTTTAHDTRVMGVSQGTAASGGVSKIVIAGNTSVTADSAAVAIGDQLVTSSTSGDVTVDNNATTGILGYATSPKAGGSAGSVNVYVQPVGGVNNPTIPGTLTVNTITPTAAFTVGATGQAFTLQGNNSSSIVASNGTNTTTLGFQNPTANVTYQLQSAAAGTYQICTTVGNCLGGGGGGANTALSNLTGVAINTSLLPGSAAGADLGSATLPFGKLFVAGTSGTPGTNNFQFTGVATAARTITIPDATGTICLTTGNCLGGAGGGANTALSNLTGVAINTTLLPGAAGTVNLGSSVLPFGQLFVAGTSGSPASNNFQFTGISTGGTRTITIPDLSGTICLTAGNCAGVGGSIAGTGTVNKIAKFTSSSGIGDSSISDTGSSVTITPGTNSTTAFQIQNATTTPILTVDSTNTKVTVQAATDTSPALVVANSDGTAGIEVRSGGSGAKNTFIGLASGANNVANVGATTGINSTALGYHALQGNTDGTANTAVGIQTLEQNTTGGFNNAFGAVALNSNTTGHDNNAFGTLALNSNVTGNFNLAAGNNALYHNTASNNTGLGQAALFANTTGANNTAVGYAAGGNGVLTAGSNNTFLGYQAGYNDDDGFQPIAALQNAGAIGANAQVQANNSLVLGGTGTDAVNVGVGTTIPQNTFSVSPVNFHDGTASVGSVGFTVTGIGTTWNANMIGLEFIFFNGQHGIITAVGSPTSLTLDTSQPITAASNYRIQTIGLQVSSYGNAGVGNLSSLPSSARLTVTSSTSDTGQSALDVTSANGNVLGQFLGDGTVNLGGNGTTKTYGVTAPGAGTGSGVANIIFAQRVTTTAGGPATSISTYIRGGVEAAPNNQYQMAIYADNSCSGNPCPGAYVASTSVNTLVNNAWNTLAISANLAASTNYWLVYWSNSALGGNNQTYNTGVSGSQWYYNTQTFGSGGSNGMPTNFPTGGGTLTSNNFQFVQYVTIGDTQQALQLSGSNGSALFKNSSNSTTAFQVQNVSGINLLNIDTANSGVTAGVASGAASTLIQGGTNGIALNTGALSTGSGGIYLSTGNSSAAAAGSITLDNGTNVSGVAATNTPKTFESGLSNMADGSGYSDTISSSTDTAHSGTHSLKVVAGNTIWRVYDAEPFNITGLVPYHTYTFGFWIKAGSVSGTASLTVNWSSNGFGGGGLTGSQSFSNVSDNSSGWTFVTATAVAPAGTGSLQIQIDGSTPSAGNVHYVDDVSVVDTTAINIGTVNAQAVNIGNSGMTGSTYLQAGSTSESLSGSGATIKTSTNSATAFQVQNAAGSSLLNVSTSANSISLLSGAGGDTGAWSTAANAVTSARQYAGSVIYNGFMYVIAGADGATSGDGTAQSTVYYSRLNADGTPGTWTTSATSPLARMKSSMVVANGYLYILGGVDNVGPNASNKVQYARINSDGSLGTWTTDSTTIFGGTTRDGHTSVFLNGYVYVLNGQGVYGNPPAGGAPGGTMYVSKLNADGSAGTWVQTTALGVNRLFAASVAVNGYIYIIGGGSDATPTDTNTVYYGKQNSDGTVSSWTTTSALPASIDSAAAGVADGYMYVMGGRSSGTAQAAVYYAKINSDGTVGSWSTSANPLTAGRYGLTSVVANGNIYAIAGNNGSGAQSQVYYAPLPKVQIAGDLDLVGLQGVGYADGGSLSQGDAGGGLTAGNIRAIGSLTVAGPSLLNNGLSVNGNTAVQGDVYVTNTAPATVSGAALNGTSATTTLSVLGATGGATNGTTSNTAGTGGAISLQGGTGGAETGSSGTETGGTGGTLSLASGTGGATTTGSGGAQTGGTGGALAITAGTGGAAAHGVGGTGGSITITAGTGGSSSGSNNNPNGGNITLSAGAPGTNGTGTAGTAGSVIVKSPTNGNSTTAFMVQNAASAQLLTTDTTNLRVGINATYTAMSAPAGLTVGPATAGGSLTATTTYFYEVTAIDSAGGETAASTEVSAATTGANKTMPVSWTAVSGASAYRLYRSTSTGTEVYLTTVQTNSFNDTGTFSIGTATPPVSGSSYVSTNVSNSSLQLSVGGNGTPTGQLYVSGTVPSGKLAQIQEGSTSHGLVVSGRYAYVADTNNSKVRIVDVSNPAAMADKGTVSLSGSPQNIVVAGRFAYVATTGTDALDIIDVSNPSSPSQVGTISTGINSPFGIAVQGRYVYVSNQPATTNTITVYDVSNPAVPTQVGTVNTDSGTANVSTGTLYIAGRYLYAVNNADATHGLEIFDINNPAAPVSVGTHSTASLPRGVYVQGRYAYVTNHSANTLTIYDVSNPTSIPATIGTATTHSQPQSVVVQGRYAYITNQNDAAHAFEIIDVSNPAAPVSLGSAAGDTGAFAMSVSGRYAYTTLAANPNFLSTYDLGGEYAQQFQAGGIEAGTLQTNGNAIFNGDAFLQGGLNIGQSAQVGGDLGVNGSATFANSTNSASAVQVQNAAGTPVITADTINSKLSVQGINSVAVLGAELASGTACSGTNWSGTGPWAHATGSTTSLSCTTPATVTAGAVYQVTFDTTGSPTAGETVKPNVGNVNGQTVGGNSASQVQLITAANTNNLKFTPTINWNGNIANISLKLLTPANTVLNVTNSDATTGIEVRAGGSGLSNTFIGVSAGASNTTGVSSVAVGYQALQNNTAGTNSALGYQALQQNTTGSTNTAVGYQALQNNTSANQNTALGYQALENNTTGSNNTAVGKNALIANTSGTQNTAVGQGALQTVTTGSNNTAVGQNALSSLTVGNTNTAVGKQAGNAITTGQQNTFLGYQAGYQDPSVTTWNTTNNLQNAAALGYGSQVQASNSLILGGQGANQASVGIGTTNPTNLLSVSPDAYDTGTANVTSGTTAVTNGTGATPTWTTAMVGDELIFADGTKYTISAVPTSTSITLSGNASATETNSAYRIHQPAFQVTSAGKVGIGTTNPTANFQVTTQTNSTTAFQIQNASGTSLFTVDTTNSQINVNANTEANGYFDNGIGGIGQFANMTDCSEQLDSGCGGAIKWVTSNATVTADAATAPDNQTSAESVADTSSGGKITYDTTTAVGATYTFSLWMRSTAGTQACGLKIIGTTTAGGGTEQDYTCTTTWQRFSVTHDTSIDTGNVKLAIYPGTGAGSGTVYAWGAQLVAGTSPLVYVRSTTTAISTSNGVVSNGGLFVESQSTADVPLVVQGFPSQSGNLINFKSSSGSGLSAVSAAGNFFTASSFDTFSATTVLFGNTNATAVTIGNATNNIATTILGTALVKPTPSHDSTTAFQVQNAGGAALFIADTSNERLYVGPTAGDTVGALLVLGNKTNAGDPTGVAGAMYYNSSTNKFRCYQNSTWYDCIGIAGDYQRQNPFISCEFVGGSDTSQCAPWFGNKVGGNGSEAAQPTLVTANHPGVVGMGNNATSGGGFRWAWSNTNTNLILGGGETTEFVFNPDNLTNASIRFGYWDGQDASSAVANGAYVDIASTGVLTGKTAKTSTGSSTGTTYTVSTATWYRLKIVVNTNATQIDYYLYDDSSTQLWHDSLSTNIPTATVDHAVAASTTTASGQTIMDMDYMAFWETNKLTR